MTVRIVDIIRASILRSRNNNLAEEGTAAIAGALGNAAMPSQRQTKGPNIIQALRAVGGRRGVGA